MKTFIFIFAFCAGLGAQNNDILQLKTKLKDAKDADTRFDLYCGIGLLCVEANQIDSAFLYACFAFSETKIFSKGQKANHFELEVAISEHFESNEKAIAYYREKVAIFKKINGRLYASASLLLALRYEHISEYFEAANTLYLVLPWYEAQRDSGGLLHVHNDLGYQNIRLRRYKEADTHLKLALKFRQNLGGNAYYPYYYLGLLNYDWRIKMDTAKYYYKLSYIEAQKDRNQKRMANTSVELANCAMYEKDFRQAELLLSEAALLFESVGNKNKYAYTLGTLAGAQRDLKKYQKAMITAQKYFALAENMNSFEHLEGSQRLIAELYADMGNFRKAWQETEKWTSLKDSLTRHQIAGQMAEQEALYKVKHSENEAQIATYKLEKQQQQQQVWVFLGVLLSLLFLLAVLWWRNKEALKRQLTEQQLSIEHSKNDLLASLAQKKNQFLMNISHEFRTPLSVILAATDVLCEQYPLQTRTINTIKRNSEQLLRLVNELLDLARLEVGKLELQPKTGDVMSFIRAVSESFDYAARQKNITFFCRTTPASLFIEFDLQRLQQIIDNTLGNAVKFTPQGGSICVSAVFHKNVSQLTLTVEDTGIGIKLEDLPQIFELFYRADGSNTRQNEGVGIGLSLVKELVTLMNGKIFVESEPNTKTRFEITLPVSEITSTENSYSPALTYQPITEVYETDAAQLDNDDTKPLILVVEDNFDLRHYLSEIFRDEYRVLLAQNGQDGILLAQTHIPDVVISDVMMPIIDGYTMSEILKNDERTSHIPIVLLTAKATLHDKLAGLHIGVDAYLNKPFDKGELLATLESLLKNRQRLANRLANLPIDQVPDETQINSIGVREQIFLQKVHAAIDAHLDEESFDTPKLAKQMTMSRMQLHRKLTAITGQSASLVIRTYRLKKANQLLLQSDLSISEVAYHTGFSDHAYFSRCYKEFFGETPSESRKKA